MNLRKKMEDTRRFRKEKGRDIWYTGVWVEVKKNMNSFPIYNRAPILEYGKPILEYGILPLIYSSIE